jgi:hypothetical protein
VILQASEVSGKVLSLASLTRKSPKLELILLEKNLGKDYLSSNWVSSCLSGKYMG